MVKNPPASARDKRCEFDHWVGKTPWNRKLQGSGHPTPVFMPDTDRGARGHKELDMTSTHAHI